LLYELDNCLALKDQCSSVVCIRGDCISSPDGTKAYCLCPEEAFGERCEHLRGNWAQWSSWSACFPACGHGILRQRERVRSCLGEACFGGPGGRQIEACEGNLPCADELMILGQGLEALVPQDGAYADAKPNIELQRKSTYRKRRYRLFTSLVKLMVAFLAIFAVTAATIIPLYVLLY
uniref:EGF-like domain-containing protein n=1 Tax=Schistocephalus solidus TaxID=70667 RepID=A0A183TBK6_SCHSO